MEIMEVEENKRDIGNKANERGTKMNKISKQELLELKEKVNTIPISNIILSRIDHQADGTCNCPFHNDKTPGSFHYDDKKNWFKCFSCNTSGDGVNFVEMLENKSFSASVLELSAEYGIIGKDDYRKYTGKDFDRSVQTFNPTVVIGKLDKERSAPEITDTVFKRIMDVSPLSTQHRAYLNGRGISDEQIKEVGYFTLPLNKGAIERALNDSSFKTELQGVMRENGFKDTDLSQLRIPGVYLNSNGKFALSQQFGLGIPIRDTEGKIQAIQIRRDNIKPGEVRYLWWTSNKFDNGATPGCPVDISYPTRNGKMNIKEPAVLISEGHFKARALANNNKAISLSLQGVQNIKEMDQQLKQLFENPATRFDKVRIFFDMDICKNENIYLALENLYKDLNGPELYKSIALDRSYDDKGQEVKFPLPFEKYDTKREILIELWDPKIGKGADDYIDAGGKKFTTMRCDVFLDRYKNNFLASQEMAVLREKRKEYSDAFRNTPNDQAKLQLIEQEVTAAENACEDLFRKDFLGL